VTAVNAVRAAARVFLNLISPLLKRAMTPRAQTRPGSERFTA
jgi:hypothetical protein